MLSKSDLSFSTSLSFCFLENSVAFNLSAFSFLFDSKTFISSARELVSSSFSATVVVFSVIVTSKFVISDFSLAIDF